MLNEKTGKIHCDYCMACGCGVTITKIKDKDVCTNCKSYLDKGIEPIDSNKINPNVNYSKADCGFTVKLLQVWKIKLECADSRDKLLAIGLTKDKYNSHIETLNIAIAEAINTGDTCKYYIKLVPIQSLMMNIQKNAGC